MPHKHRAASGVFTQNAICLFQYFYGAVGHVAQIADRRWYQVQMHNVAIFLE
jgi:hypothetical protein